MDEESLNWTLKNLGDRSNLKSKRKLHWHLGRKLVIRTSAQLGINQWNCKMLVGKSVPKDIETYINGIQLKEDFVKLHDVLRLKPAEASQQSEDLKEALKQVESENAAFKIRIDELQRHVVDIKSRLKGKDSMVKELSKNVDDLRLTVTELVEGKDNEAFKSAYGYLESHASRLETIVQNLQDRVDRIEGKKTLEETIAELDTQARRKSAIKKHRKLKGN